jgi:hypothetical protein
MKYAWLLLTAAGALYILATPHAAIERLKPGYMACTNTGNCVPTDKLTEYPFTQLDDGRIRVYLPDDQYTDLYVAPEALPEV